MCSWSGGGKSLRSERPKPQLAVPPSPAEPSAIVYWAHRRGQVGEETDFWELKRLITCSREWCTQRTLWLWHLRWNNSAWEGWTVRRKNRSREPRFTTTAMEMLYLRYPWTSSRTPSAKIWYCGRVSGIRYTWQARKLKMRRGGIATLCCTGSQRLIGAYWKFLTAMCRKRVWKRRDCSYHQSLLLPSCLYVLHHHQNRHRDYARLYHQCQ